MERKNGFVEKLRVPEQVVSHFHTLSVYSRLVLKIKETNI